MYTVYSLINYRPYRTGLSYAEAYALVASKSWLFMYQ